MALQLFTLLLLAFPFVASAFRENDQPNILDGGFQLAHGASFFGAIFYNFDKQWGTFLALDAIYRFFPHADPVLASNVLLTTVASLAWISLGIRTGRERRAPLPLLLPILLSPALILYIPFFGTGWLSLAFLLLAFFFLGRVQSRWSQAIGLLLLAAAAACRGDVLLAVPALAVSLVERARLRGLVKKPIVWLLGVSALAPVLFGKWIAGRHIPDTNPLGFDIGVYLGFLIFGFTVAMTVLLVTSAVAYLKIARNKRRYAFFYTVCAIAPLLPFVFYSLQLYSVRYYFLTIASLLFIVSSRRSTWLYWALRRNHPSSPKWTAALVVLTILPWIIGLNVPVLSRPGLTLTHPTALPNSDGRLSMGAYLGFEWQFHKSHLQIDHNQRIWLAARTVPFQNCSDGTVPYLFTPMSNYLEFAIRLQSKVPQAVNYMPQSHCGFAYVDARSILRGSRPTPQDGPFFNQSLTFISSLNNGQLIVRVDSAAKQSSAALILRDLHRIFLNRDTEIHLNPGRRGSMFGIPVDPGLQYAVFSDSGSCRLEPGTNLVAIPPDSTLGSTVQARFRGSSDANGSPVKVTCSGALAGWAQTVFPPYMGI